MEIRWRKDELAEDLLERLGLTWVDQVVSLESIDWLESLNNGARLEQPILEELVEDYMAAMSNGAAFPKPVMYSYRGKAPVIISGNQRSEAVKRMDPKCKIPVYLVTSEDRLKADLFLRAANVGLGERSTRDNRFKQAVLAVRQHGLTIADAAKMFLVSEHSVSARIREEDVRRDLDRANVPGAERLTLSHCNALSKLPNEMIPRVASVCSIALPSAERLSQAVAVINAKKSHAERIKALGAFENELKEAAIEQASSKAAPSAIRIRKARKDRIVALLTQAANFLETGMDGQGFTDLEQLQCGTEKDRTVVCQLWRRVAVRMKLICED